MSAKATLVLPCGALSDGVAALHTLLDDSAVDGIEIVRPTGAALPYRALIDALLRRTGFRLDFGARSPTDALDLIGDKLLGPGSFAEERASFAADIAGVAATMQALAGGAPPLVSLRSYFAPGDLVWHLDRMNGGAAFRFVWPIARPAGMELTSVSNIDPTKYTAFMHREHALLGRLDTRVSVGEGTVETLWAHRPAQLAALQSGRFPFVIDPERYVSVTPGHASIHRVETPARAGAFHRSSWANRHAPGLQLVITAGADR